MKLSDFGLFHSLDNGESKSGEKRFLLASTEGWFFQSDPVDEDGNRDFSFDIFPLGCVCAFIASHGVHPFGVHLEEAITRIKKQRPIKLGLSQLDKNLRTDAFLHLVNQMVIYDCNKRPSASEILSHLSSQSVVSVRNQLEVLLPCYWASPVDLIQQWTNGFPEDVSFFCTEGKRRRVKQCCHQSTDFAGNDWAFGECWYYRVNIWLNLVSSYKSRLDFFLNDLFAISIWKASAWKETRNRQPFSVSKAR